MYGNNSWRNCSSISDVTGSCSQVLDWEELMVLPSYRQNNRQTSHTAGDWPSVVWTALTYALKKSSSCRAEKTVFDICLVLRVPTSELRQRHSFFWRTWISRQAHVPVNSLILTVGLVSMSLLLNPCIPGSLQLSLTCGSISPVVWNDNIVGNSHCPSTAIAVVCGCLSLDH